MASLNDQDKGLFSSILADLARPGEIVRNLLAGRGESAARHAGQLGLDLVDAIMPGDFLRNDLARTEDNLSGRELVGLPDTWYGNLGGLAVEVGTDPISWLPSSWFAKGTSAIGKAAGLAAEKAVGRQALESAGQHLRSTLGLQKLSPEIADTVNVARATQSGVGQAGAKALDELLRGTNAEQQNLLGEIGLNVKRRDGLASVIDPTDALPIRDRAMSHLAGRNDADQLAGLAEQIAEFNRRQFQTGRDELGIFADGKGVEDYFPRQFSGVKAGDLTEDAFGRPSAIRGRKLERPQDVADFLNANPDVSLETNAQRALGSRAEQQGSLAAKATVGKRLVGDDFTLALDEHKAKLDELIKTLPPDEAQVVGAIVNGLPQRGAFTSLLSKLNSGFKSYATAGFALPKLGFNVRNRLSGIWQAASVDGGTDAVGGLIKRFPGDLAGSIAEGMGLSAPDELGKVISRWDDALTKSGGSYKTALDALAKTDPDVATAIRHGALEGFVRTEDMLSAAKSDNFFAKAFNAAKWPAKITRGIEDRMRLGMTVDLMRAGKTPEEAARIVKDALLNYSTSSAANRTFKDLVPFGAYLAQTIPQQTKFLSKSPRVTSAIANAMTEDEPQNVMPSMVGKLNVDLGDGNYVSNFGLPFEGLANIPNPSASLKDFGRQVERNVVGSVQPLVKSAYSTVSSRDPYFGTTYGSFSRLPGGIDGGEAGRLLNQITGAGLPGITPFDQLSREIGQLADDRKSIAVRALDVLTGANVQHVDPDVALQRRLTDALEANPNVIQARTPINISGDPETAALIQELREAKARNKAKRLAEMAKGDITG